MKIRSVLIRNFRGIRELDWTLPSESITCLVGRGDSTKSTILEALRRIFYPQWNLVFDDSDFHLCSTAELITIEVVLGELPDAFRDIHKYGLYLSGWDSDIPLLVSEPGDGHEEALRVRLQVGEDLEPQWTVVKGEDESSVQFKPSDRAKVAVGMINASSDRNLTWSKGTRLNQLTKTENIQSSLAHIPRAAKAALDERREQELAGFDAVAARAETTARDLGVRVSQGYRAHLDVEAINIGRGGLALHDGEIPLRRLGSGSKRMLITGLQQQTAEESHVTLFDEVEFGLEPHRISRLLNYLSKDDSGQYLLTTHSPVVLRELSVTELHIVQCDRGNVTVVAAAQPGLADFIQGRVRASAEAFLAPKIVVCEGATEVGFLRGFDDYWIDEHKMPSFAYKGVSLLDAVGAGTVKNAAKALSILGYQVAVLVDSDADEQFSDADADELTDQGIVVAKWTGKLSIEERVFMDLPWEGVRQSFQTALSNRGELQGMLDQIRARYAAELEDCPDEWSDNALLRSALGAAAKAGGWFKRQDIAREWAAVVAPSIGNVFDGESDLCRQLLQLRNWVDGE